MSKLKVTQCQGEGQGSCKRCNDKGKWNRAWMCFLYKIEGYEGCYCSSCVEEIKTEHEVQEKIDYIKFCKGVLSYEEDDQEIDNMIDAIFTTLEDLREMGYNYEYPWDFMDD